MNEEAPPLFGELNGGADIWTSNRGFYECNVANTLPPAAVLQCFFMGSDHIA
jgi:hypothetical protein